MNYLHILTMLVKFSFGISFIVAVHELGHMLFAKLFGMHVEQYMIGFAPKVFSFQWGKTEYALGALPFGGSVKIAGMTDEEGLSKATKPGDFRSKSKIKQLIVIMGGIIFNLISAFIIYTAVLYIGGTTYLSKEEVNKHGIYPTTLGATVGLVHGDRVIKKNDQEFKDFSQLQTNIGHSLSYVVLRGGKTLRVIIPPIVTEAMHKGEHLMEPLIPFVIQQVIPGSTAASIGLRKGDKLIAVNDKLTPYLQDLREAFITYAKKEVTLTYDQAGHLYKQKVTLPEDNSLGIVLAPTLQQALKQYSLPKASIATLHKMGFIIKTQAKGLFLMATGKVSPTKTLSGPIGMVKIFGAAQGFASFWIIIFIISLLIAFMNALPILPLDGGHAMILLYEIVTKREFPTQWRAILQIIGIVILFVVMFFALINDVYKLR